MDGESLAIKLLNYDENDIDDYDNVNSTLMVMSFCPRAPSNLDINLINLKNPLAKPSTDVPLTLKLKELPSHLTYVFLEENHILLVIVAIDLF